MVTDEQIIKAFECCYLSKPCEECPLFNRENEICTQHDDILSLKVFELLTRQKAEIEKLEKGSLKEAMTFNSKTIANIRAEAVKEVFERLKKVGAYNNAGLILFVEKDLDSIFKEAAGEVNAG